MCKKCKTKLNGIMIFHPELCFDCVAKIHIAHVKRTETLGGGYKL